MMRFCDASLREIPGTGDTSPEGDDGELSAVTRLHRVEPIWLWLAIDVR
jgi:hypothetical protein